MSDTDKRMQNAIWMDIAAFTSTYPELQRALKYALGALVRKRPQDPFSYLAEKLREANRQDQEEKLKQEDAAIKIQARGRGMRDRQRVKALKQDEKKHRAVVKIQARQRGVIGRSRVESIRTANVVWLRELYLKLSPNPQAEAHVSARDVFDYVRRDPDLVARLGLTKRLAALRPQFLPRVPGILEQLRPALSKGLDWVGFAELFGVDRAQADQAELHKAATKIQAVQRRRRDADRARTVEEARRQMETAMADGALLGYVPA